MQHHSFINLCESLDDAQNDDLAREYVCAMAGKDCIDDMTGQPLHPVLVDEAKTKELDYFVQKGGLVVEAYDRGQDEDRPAPDFRSEGMYE